MNKYPTLPCGLIVALVLAIIIMAIYIAFVQEEETTVELTPQCNYKYKIGVWRVGSSSNARIRMTETEYGRYCNEN